MTGITLHTHTYMFCVLCLCVTVGQGFFFQKKINIGLNIVGRGKEEGGQDLPPSLLLQNLIASSMAGRANEVLHCLFHGSPGAVDLCLVRECVCEDLRASERECFPPQICLPHKKKQPYIRHDETNGVAGIRKTNENEENKEAGRSRSLQGQTTQNKSKQKKQLHDVHRICT